MKIDPVVILSKILTEIKSIGIQKEIPPNQLRQGFGIFKFFALISLVNKVI